MSDGGTVTTNDQTMVKAWPAHIIERINPMPDETNDDVTNGETQPVEVEADETPEPTNWAQDVAGSASAFLEEGRKAFDIDETADDVTSAGVVHIEGGVATDPPETPDAVPADDAPATGEGVSVQSDPGKHVWIISFPPDGNATDRYLAQKYIYDALRKGLHLHASVGTRDYVTLIYVRESE